MYAILGGKTKGRLPVYSTTGRPDIAKKLGFVGAKVPCPYGPADGDEGLRKNVEFFQGWREKVTTNCIIFLFHALISHWSVNNFVMAELRQ